MKKECAYTRKHLARYLAGRLFALQRRRIERHLATCVVCSSEFDAIRRIDETQRLLRDIAPAEGFARTLQAGSASVSAIQRLFYRPLWLVMIVAAAVAAYFYVINPLLHDPDLERLDAPPPPAAAPTARLPQSAPTDTAAAEAKKSAPAASPAASQPPLVITITVEQEKERANLRRINDAMKEHALLRTMRFSETTREISGSLTASELYTFFNRIDGVGKVTYKRSRLAAAREGELVPFVIRLQAVSAPSRPAGEQSAEQPVEKPAEKPAAPAAEGTSPAPPPGQ